MLRFIRLIPLFFALNLASASSQEFIAGADLSHLVFFESRGGKYKESNRETDALQILASRGLNCVRLRLFTSTPAQAANDPYNYINNLDYTLPLAQRVKRAGLKFLLDFHYSDSWADPGKQIKPAAWTNLAFTRLEAELLRYSSNSIAAFKAAGAMPDFVQIGNEVSVGFLWPEGRVGSTYENPTQWSHLGALMKSAIRGVLDASGDNPPKIIIHIDRGGDWNATQWYFDNLQAQQVPFDIIGQSYYPFWHGPLSAFQSCFTNAIKRYDKPVFLMETAFPWTNSAGVQGIPATPAGQIEYTARLAKILNNVPGQKTAGVFWWAAEYLPLPGVPTAGFDARSFFDGDGNVLPVVGTYGTLTAPLRLRASRTDDSIDFTWPLSGSAFNLSVTESLLHDVHWTILPVEPQPSERGFQTTVSANFDITRFFRLELP